MPEVVKGLLTIVGLIVFFGFYVALYDRYLSWIGYSEEDKLDLASRMSLEDNWW